MPEHAILSASSANRWLECPPSALLCRGNDDRRENPIAQQGTDCHALGAYLVEKILGRDVQDPTEDLTYYDQEMQEYAESYAAYVKECVEEIKALCPELQILVEQRLDFSRWAPGGFGTADCVIVADGVLQVIDLKYGSGVLVSAERNAQLMCYALGALDRFEVVYEIREIRMTIFQPRRENISTFCMTKEELLTWAKEVLKPAAQLAYAGKGEFKAGEYCRFCKVKATCRKRAELFTELEGRANIEPATLDPAEIAELLPKVDRLVAWAGDVKEFALRIAKAGTKIPGYKVVQGHGRRRFTDEDAVAEVVKAAGFDPYEKKLRGITALTAMLGKKKFDAMLGSLVYRPPGAETLVPDTDSRPVAATVQDDFKDD